MDKQRKKELQEAYKHRHPQMGVLSFKCTATGESFLEIATDTTADFNSDKFKLLGGIHPNKRLQALWAQYGAEGFDCSVLKVLDYENREEDHTKKLEALREACLAQDPQAQKI